MLLLLLLLRDVDDAGDAGDADDADNAYGGDDSFAITSFFRLQCALKTNSSPGIL